MLTALRREVQVHLVKVPVQRKPALRRSDDPEALLATDLPGIAKPEAVAVFVTAMEAEGWRIWPKDGWLLLDHAVAMPQWRWPEEYPGEWGCCLWLLRNHPGEAAPAGHIRALVKAVEQGNDKVERLCRAWHEEFAGLLRAHQPLPGGLAAYLCNAMKEEAK